MIERLVGWGRGIEVLKKIRENIELSGEEKIEGHEIATISINLHEIVYGFLKVKKEIVNELIEFNILDYTRSDALLSAKLEVELEKIGKPAGRFDTDLIQ